MESDILVKFASANVMPDLWGQPLPEPMLNLIDNWTPKNKLQWNLNQENIFENVVCKMATILFRTQLGKYKYCISDFHNLIVCIAPKCTCHYANRYIYQWHHNHHARLTRSINVWLNFMLALYLTMLATFFSRSVWIFMGIITVMLAVKFWQTITLTPYMLLPLFATRFADYAGGIRVSFIQPRLV